MILVWMSLVDLPSINPKEVKKTMPKMGFQAIWSMPTLENTVFIDVPGSILSSIP